MKNSFKILLCTVLVLLSLTACIKTHSPSSSVATSEALQPSQAESSLLDFTLFESILLLDTPATKYSRLGNTDWGMSVEQATKALGYKESDFISEYINPNSDTLLLTKDDGAFDGIACSLTLKFEIINGLTDNRKILVDAMLNTNDKRSAEMLIDVFTEKYSPETPVTIENGGYFFTDKPVYLYCNQSEWEKFIGYYYDLSQIANTRFDKSTAEQIVEMSIGSVSLKILGNNTDSPHYRFSFYGRNMAILNQLRQS